MQTIFEDEDERSNGKRAGSMDTIIYTERISRCVKRECVRRFGDRRTRIQVSRRIFGRIKKEVWRRR